MQQKNTATRSAPDNGIRRDEWLRALRDADAADDAIDTNDSDAMTTEEFAVFIGVKRCAANARLQRLARLGLAEKTRKRIRRSDGARITVTAYRLVQPHAAKGRR